MNRVIIRYSHVESLGKCRRVLLKTLMLLKILFNINSPFGFVIFNIVYSKMFLLVAQKIWIISTYYSWSLYTNVDLNVVVCCKNILVTKIKKGCKSFLIIKIEA